MTLSSVSRYQHARQCDTRSKAFSGDNLPESSVDWQNIGEHHRLAQCPNIWREGYFSRKTMQVWVPRNISRFLTGARTIKLNSIDRMRATNSNTITKWWEKGAAKLRKNFNRVTNRATHTSQVSNGENGLDLDSPTLIMALETNISPVRQNPALKLRLQRQHPPRMAGTRRDKGI
jgi:hypothetical protein